MPPRRQIPAHVFNYSLALMPAVAYAYYYNRNAPSDEDLENILRKDYSSTIKESENKRQQMTQFIENAVKKPTSDQKMDRKLSSVLLSGKGEMKRQLPVDKTLYGTEEGAKKAADMWEQAKLEQKEKRKKKKKRDRSSKKSESGAGSLDADTANAPTETITTLKNDLNGESESYSNEPQNDSSSAKGKTHSDATTVSTNGESAGIQKISLGTDDLTKLALVAIVASTAGYFLGNQRTR